MKIKSVNITIHDIDLKKDTIRESRISIRISAAAKSSILCTLQTSLLGT